MSLSETSVILKLTCVALVTAAIAWAPKGVAAAWLMAFETPSVAWSTPVLWKKSVGSTMGAWPSVVSQALHTTCSNPTCQEQAVQDCTDAMQHKGERLSAPRPPSLIELQPSGGA